MRPCRRDGRLGPGSATVYLFLSFSLSFLVFLDHEQAFTFFFFFFFFVCRAGPDCSVRCFICRRERERESVCVCVGLDRLGSTCLRKRRSWGVGGGGVWRLTDSGPCGSNLFLVVCSVEENGWRHFLCCDA
ncbi:hypothetical protein IWX91DRAFT_40169 [Phyllosticta citricarpa]